MQPRRICANLQRQIPMLALEPWGKVKRQCHRRQLQRVLRTHRGKH
ncbi:MAG: hypothetical protein ACFFBQ_17540 [Promethearchaeota archaeon]